jgi:hypothetical protein
MPSIIFILLRLICTFVRTWMLFYLLYDWVFVMYFFIGLLESLWLFIYVICEPWNCVIYYLLGFAAENNIFPTNLFPWSIYVVERQQSSGGVHTFENRVRGNVPAQTLLMKTTKANLNSCICTSRWRPAPQEQRLWGIAHARCIDIVWAPVQQSSGRRKTRTRNPAAWWRPTRWVSSNSRARLQNVGAKPGRREEEMGWMSQGSGRVYIGVGG